jgi:hypothetical protein
MRPLFLSLGAGVLVVGAALAQNDGDDTSGKALVPVGQIFKQFEYPVYNDSTLKATLHSVQAKGITLNRVEATTLTINVYENGNVTTIVTSPDADLYMGEQKMRTKNTVRIVRSDMTATSQDCDFDLKDKKYLLQSNVKVILKNIDLGATPAKPGTKPGAPSARPAAKVSVAPSAQPLNPAHVDESLLDSPGAVGATNSAPIPPSDSK